MVAGRAVRNERNARTSESIHSFSPEGAIEPCHPYSRTPPGCLMWWAHRVPVVTPPATIFRPSGTEAICRHVFSEFFIDRNFIKLLGKDQGLTPLFGRRVKFPSHRIVRTGMQNHGCSYFLNKDSDPFSIQSCVKPQHSKSFPENRVPIFALTSFEKTRLSRFILKASKSGEKVRWLAILKCNSRESAFALSIKGLVWIDSISFPSAYAQKG